MDGKRVEVLVSEGELRLAMSEMYNSGYAELVGADGVTVVLVDKDLAEGE